VGNAVLSENFYPLSLDQFKDLRKRLDYPENSEILTWMSNDRPKKGFSIFKSVAKKLMASYENLHVIIIGTEQEILHQRAKTIGRIPNYDIPNYLQISNYYMFTTLYDEGFGLSMIEALKCGNSVIASNKGAIPEILNDLDRTFLVDSVNTDEAWISCFEKARIHSNFGQIRPNKSQTSTIWNYNNWEQKFTNAISEVA
jgi:glycosyltransferase involved in cell wall biosynthesis